ncbi:MAG: D-alanine--D-alanine ligase [Clostridia bacterium]|nr:D-alanine--D-alanine ligase [Clostridia bacterium]
MKTQLAFMFGGRSVEHEISVISAQQAMAAADKTKYDIIPIYIAKDGMMYTHPEMTSVDAFKNVKELLGKASRVILVNDGQSVKIEKYPRALFGGVIGTVDVVIPVMHGTWGEDGNLQGYLETLMVPYAGCDTASSALGMDKVLMKQILQANGVPVLPCEYFYTRAWVETPEEIISKIEKIGYPVIVKPASLGSSVGIKIAKNQDELKEAVDEAASYSEKILVEKAITALREINCSAMGDVDEVKTSVCEEPFSGDEILSYKDKYMKGGKGKTSESGGMASLDRKVPADLDKETETKIRSYVADTFKALGCCGVSRVDCMIDKDSGEIFVNEINTIPGSLSFYLWKEAGVEFNEIIDELVRLALKRDRKRKNLTFSYDTNILELGFGSKGVKK